MQGEQHFLQLGWRSPYLWLILSAVLGLSAFWLASREPVLASLLAALATGSALFCRALFGMCQRARLDPLASLIEACDTPLALLDEELRFLAVNAALARILGQSTEKLGGQALADLPTSSLHDHLRRCAAQAGEALLIDLPATTPEGLGQRLRCCFKTLPDARGLLQLEDVSHEIASARALEQRSAAARGYVESIFDMMPFQLSIKNAESRYVLINQAFCRHRNKSKEELLGRTPLDIAIRRDDALKSMAEDREVILDGKSFLFEEFINTDKSGVESYRVIAKARVYDDFGTPLVAVGLMDISEARLAERRANEALNAQTRARQFLQIVFDSLPLPLFVKDTKHRYIMANRAHAASVTRNAADIIGLRAQDITAPDVANRMESAERDLLAQPDGVVSQVEVTHPERTGKFKHLLAYKVAAVDPEGQRLLIGANFDLTPQREAEEELRRHRDHLQDMVLERTADLMRAKEQADDARDQAERANEAKSLFLANMSHELRTPMHAILSFASLGETRGEQNVEKTRGWFNRIRSSGERLLALLNDLLDLAKLEAGHMDLQMSPVRLAQVVDDAVGEYEAWLHDKHITVARDFAADTPAVQGDAVRLGQVVRNLMTNAIKFSPVNGTLRLTLRQTTLSSGRQTAEGHDAPGVELQIADEGLGIPPAELESIFDKFVQSSSTSTGAGGTGLGLAICREIVVMHRGHIHARNREGGGAEFVVRLPAVEPPASN